MIVSDQLVTALATAVFPTFAVLIGILINNHRLNDVQRRFDDFGRVLDTRFSEVNRRIDDTKDVLRAEMFRIEQVLDARLKHLEESLPH
ncbi:MAG TPA: hypothetical protein VHB50_02675 [Bryobacteraceae bacterium]|nr:hypothetical protein [Bryobacteraceae bacterium]